jgi:hypothetical protein
VKRAECDGGCPKAYRFVATASTLGALGVSYFLPTYCSGTRVHTNTSIPTNTVSIPMNRVQLNVFDISLGNVVDLKLFTGSGSRIITLDPDLTSSNFLVT